MPGPVSDSYDAEWSTSANRDLIDEGLAGVYAKLSAILGHQPPLYAVDLARQVRDGGLAAAVPATLTEGEWRLLRFAVERARDSL